MDFTTYEPRISALEAGGGGGGGDSDLSKALVTLIAVKESDTNTYLSMPVCIDYVDEEYPEDNYSALSYEAAYFNGSTYGIPLYKGEYRMRESIFNNESTEFEISGNAVARWNTITRSWGFRIFGNCTITLVKYV